MSVISIRDLIPRDVMTSVSNGAKLLLHPEDVNVLKTWTPTTDIQVTIENRLSDYPLKLTNAVTGASIRVKVVK